MDRTLLPKTLTLLLLAMVSSAGQTKPSGEVDPVKCWVYPTGEASGEMLASDGAQIFIGIDGGKVEALSPDGKKVWSSDLGGEIRSNILPAPGTLLLVTATASTAAGNATDNILRSLSRETGITSWTLKLAAAEEYFLGSANGSVVVISKDGAIQAFDTKNGTPKWKRQIAESFVGEPVFTGSRAIVAAASGELSVVSLVTGEIASIRKSALSATALAETADGASIVGDGRGNVTLFTNGSDKPYWKFKSGGEISHVFEAGGQVVAISHDNFVYLLAGRSGSVLWKKRMPGRISSASVHAGKYVVLSSFEEHSAIILDLSNGKVIGQIPLAGDETVTAIDASGKTIFVLSSAAAYGFSLTGCLK